MAHVENEPIVNLQLLQAMFKRAWETGEYPNWNVVVDEDGISHLDSTARPRSFLDANGNITNDAAYLRAAQNLHFHLISNATFVMPHFNCLIQVKFMVIYGCLCLIITIYGRLCSVQIVPCIKSI